MIKGIKLKASPTNEQKQTLSQWMGCARFIWNAKCDENRYYTTFARKYYPAGTYAPVDKKAAHFKTELSPWLKDCPSQIIRNSATNWCNTYHKFMKGECGKPKRKSKTDKGSIWLTKELFSFEQCDDGVTRLFIGAKRNNIGYLSIKTHRAFKEPKSIYIRKSAGHYTVSFCYEDGEPDQPNDIEHLKYLSGASKEWLNKNVIGVDRGVAIPVHTGDYAYDFTPEQKRSMARRERYVKRYQRKLARQTKGSARRNKTKTKISRNHARIADARMDFCHKTSRKMVNSTAKVIIFEGLKTANMTKRAAPKKDDKGNFISNKAAQKSGLNKAILNVGWHQLESFTQYKAYREGKAVFKVPAAFTSQECSEINCQHTHPDNRTTQAVFVCGNCGHVDNADRNASLVIKNRAISLLLHSGTELRGKGIPLLCSGRGANGKSRKAKASLVRGNEASKKKESLVSLA